MDYDHSSLYLLPRVLSGLAFIPDKSHLDYKERQMFIQVNLIQ